jgi:menaquinone-dependent protoporphyrinogen oxidase
MKPILVLYATREGQTRRIAEHVAANLRTHGLRAQIMDAAHPEASLDLAAYQAVVLAASVHAGKHEREMVAFVKSHRAELEQLPTVFLSTSLSEAGAEDTTRGELERTRARAAADSMIEAFFEQTGFRPTAYKPVAGALLYSQYNWLVRMVMKRIVKSEGGSTDTSQDHEYTDWVDLDRFVDGLVSGGFQRRVDP